MKALILFLLFTSNLALASSYPSYSSLCHPPSKAKPTLALYSGSGIEIRAFQDSTFSKEEKKALRELGNKLERGWYLRIKSYLQVPRDFFLSILIEDQANLEAFVVRDYKIKFAKNIISIRRDILFSPFLGLHLSHEFQHVLNNHFKSVGQSPWEEEWLQEGLSNFVGFKMTGLVPEKGLHKVFSSYYNSQIDGRFSCEHNHNSTYQYANSFLFISYLYDHFGGDELLRALIRSEKKSWDNIISAIKVHAPEDVKAFSTKASLLLNYHSALLINDKNVGKYSLLSLADNTAFENARVSSLPFHFPINGQREGEAFKISPGWALYLNIPRGENCLEVSKSQNLIAITIDSSSKLEVLDNQLCTRTNESQILMMSNPSESDAIIQFKK